jgi:hypothetical protein
MKLNKILIAICFCAAFKFNANAQNENALVLTKIRFNLLEKVEDYSQLSGISNEDEKEKFYKLFISDTVLVNNDIMPDNKLLQKLTVKEYSDLIPNFHSLAIKTTIRPYNIGIQNIDASNSGEYWVDAKKSISSVSKKGINYVDTFDIRITFYVNYYTGQYKITDISLNNERGRYLVITAYTKTFKKKLMSLDTMLINSDRILLNENGQYLIKNFKPIIDIRPNSDLYYGNYNLTNKELDFVLTHKEKENNIDLYFRKSVLFFEPNIFFNSFSNSLPVRANHNGIKQSKYFSYSFGLNLGYTLHEGKNGYWNIKTGFSFCKISYSNSISLVKESYNSIDADQCNYLRTNQISNLIEKHDLDFYEIPLQFEKGFRLKKGLNLYVNSGATYVFGMKGNRNTETNADYIGYYGDLYGLTIKENGVYDFGTYKLQKSSSLNMVNNLVAFDLGIGIRKKINRKISTNIGFSYKQSLGSIFEKSNKSISSNKNELNSITQVYNDFRINLFLINIGLKFKI